MLVVFVVTLAACGRNGGGPGDGRPQVLAAFYPLHEAARRVGGDLVSVTNLTPAGGEPHDLELSSRQVDRIEGADVVLYLGGGFQPAIEKVVRRSRGHAVDVLPDPASRLPATRGGDDALDADPHVWLDPRLYKAIVARVVAALAEATRPIGPPTRPTGWRIRPSSMPSTAPGADRAPGGHGRGGRRRRLPRSARLGPPPPGRGRRPHRRRAGDRALTARRRSLMAELSGGQQQRAFIARALVCEPELLVLDEPVAGVDAESQSRFRDALVARCRTAGTAVLLVSHELGAVAEDLDRLLVLRRGKLVFDGPPEDLTRGGVSLGVHASDLPVWLEGLG